MTGSQMVEVVIYGLIALFSIVLGWTLVLTKREQLIYVILHGKRAELEPHVPLLNAFIKFLRVVGLLLGIVGIYLAIVLYTEKIYPYIYIK